MKMFSIYDRKAQVYGQPFFSPDKFQATRLFARAVNDDKIQISMFPEDFDLFELGEFEGTIEMLKEGQSSLFTIHPQPQFICGAVSFKQMQKAEVNK